MRDYPPPPPPECQAAFWRNFKPLKINGFYVHRAVRSARCRALGLPTAGKNACRRYRPRWPRTGRRPVAAHVRQPCLKRAGARRAAALPPTRRGLPTVSLSGALLGEAAAATAIVRHAWQRGRIEACFRMGKAGCQAERLAFRLANPQPRLMAINCGTA